MNRAVSVWTSLAAASLLAVSLFSIAFAGAALGGLSGRPYTNTRPATAGFVVASPFVEPAAPSLPPAPPQAPVYAKAIQQATAPAVAVQTQSPSTDEMLPLTVPPPFVPLPRVETTFTALSLAPQSDRQFWAPIMMYHHVGPLPPDADAGRRDLTVSADMFERQLDALQAAGFVTTTMEAVADALDGVAPLPAKSVVLTFDDGYLDNYQVAYRALLRRGMTGTFFIVTGLLGGAEHMNWDQVKEMAAGGMEMQAHGKQHLDMSRMSATALRDQLAGSRAELERRLGLPVRIFAYPAGRYSADTIAALKAAGYRAALTTRLGSEHHTSDRYELRRMRVHGADTFAAFAGKLRP